MPEACGSGVPGILTPRNINPAGLEGKEKTVPR